MSDNAESKSWKDTLNLPDTEFPMRGNLVQREPERLAKWEDGKLYEQIQEAREGSKKYILHDGPPFANGDVHMGTALNKVLKDLVLKSKTMAGFHCPFIPGWDCHGLPIEFKVVKETRGLTPPEIRTRAEAFARKFIDIQRDSFRRLGVFADWYNPYLTLAPEYEADIVRVFAKMVERDLVYISKKPVQWSYGAQTALAEAEVEYEDRKDPAIFVKFDLVTGDLAGKSALVIWTTTPWTLPANLGIALHERLDYVQGEFSKPGREEGDAPRVENLIVAKDLVETFGEKTGFVPVGELAEFKGATLAGAEAQHPFLDRTSKVILADFVTTETGTGAVHIAPGHGADDYLAGRQNDLGLLSPVDDEGNYTDEVGVDELVGMHVFDANVPVIKILAKTGHLVGKENYTHSYPHCWRSKTPIIFRSVEQFFVKIDDLRPTALKEIDNVEWLPHWGRNRIYGTVESRPDWCISRQRTWGVPLPVFFPPEGKPIIDADVARRVADLIEEGGTNLWFEKDDIWWIEKLGLPEGTKRCNDTLDVWIDSGSSHVAVMDRREELSVPADLYLEATDQHRGWFQSSLMLSCAVRDKAPYKAVLTHGFVVDKDKKKLSKSEAEKAGKPIDAKYYYGKYGADMLRLWVSSVDWQNEVPFGEELFKQTADTYRRLRNTLRILLANINDYDAADPRELSLIDNWVLEQLNTVVSSSLVAYENFEFRKVFNLVNQFCAVDLSSLYVDITKDRMYCDATNSPRRRASQYVMHTVFDNLCRLLAPILAYTADEAWEFSGHEKSVHLEDFPEPDSAFDGETFGAKIDQLMRIRDAAQAQVDAAVKAGDFNKRERASIVVALPADDPAREILENDRDDALEFLMLSNYTVETADELAVAVSETTDPECPRCRRSIPVNDEGLCGRCADVV